MAARAFSLLAVLLSAGPGAFADEVPPNETFSFHGQLTFIEQYHPAFRSTFRGTNSLDPGSRGYEAVVGTLYFGARLWDGGEIYADPEVYQGFGLSSTLGLAAFSNGEASKVGSDTPYIRVPQLFFRQTFDLGGPVQSLEPDANQLGRAQTADNIIVTAGKFPATAVFDTNLYAHDPSSDFLNWAVIDSAAYDYAADAWGYTYGSSVEWTQSWWTLRGGFFALSREPNGKALQTDFHQFEFVGESEVRYRLQEQPGKARLLAYLNRGLMGSYDDALRLAEATHQIPGTARVREYRSRPGFALNIEQSVSDELGVFARLSFDNGDEETYEYTEINSSFVGGLSFKGGAWEREPDRVGMAFIVDNISHAARRYLAAGGLGVLIGDGALPHYASENAAEVYYNLQATDWFAATLDYQFFAHPAYNADRGPVSVLGLRLHAAF